MYASKASESLCAFICESEGREPAASRSSCTGRSYGERGDARGAPSAREDRGTGLSLVVELVVEGRRRRRDEGVAGAENQFEEQEIMQCMHSQTPGRRAVCVCEPLCLSPCFVALLVQSVSSLVSRSAPPTSSFSLPLFVPAEAHTHIYSQSQSQTHRAGKKRTCSLSSCCQTRHSVCERRERLSVSQ